MKTLALLLALGATAYAGMPPVEAIPWDSTLVVDTLVQKRGEVVVVDSHWCYFISREKYLVEVLGQKAAQDVSSIKRDLEAIKAVLKEQKK